MTESSTPDTVDGVESPRGVLARLTAWSGRSSNDDIRDDVEFITRTIDRLMRTVLWLQGKEPAKAVEPQWCASLPSTEDETVHGPWGSRQEAVDGVTLIHAEKNLDDSVATIGRVETACPVAHGGMTFRDVWETIEDNAGDEPFCWVTGPVFCDTPNEDTQFWVDAEREFRALLKRQLKSSYWSMADAGQETIDMGPDVGF